MARILTLRWTARWTLALIALLALALVVAACGDGDDAGAPTIDTSAIDMAASDAAAAAEAATGAAEAAARAAAAAETASAAAAEAAESEDAAQAAAAAEAAAQAAADAAAAAEAAGDAGAAAVAGAAAEAAEAAATAAREAGAEDAAATAQAAQAAADAAAAAAAAAQEASAAAAEAAELAAAAVMAAEEGMDDAPTAADFAGQELVLLTHDSFWISEETIDAFAAQYGVTVAVTPLGDAVEALNRAILNKGNPEGDLLFGVDNVSYVRALAEDIFLEYRPAALADIDPSLIFDDSGRVTPVDFGFVLFNYDKAALAEAGVAAPTTLEELTSETWRGRVAVEDPNTSSPGLQFMLVTIAYFGEDGDYTWLDFWADLRANDVIVSAGWSDAYYTQFSHYGGGAWLVNSYATSPAAEVIFAETALDESPTGNMIVPGGSYRQIEGVGILRGTDKEPLARAFIDFMLGDLFQADIPLNMFVYPVVSGVALPPEFLEFAEIPAEPAELDAARVTENLERWLDEWTDTVVR